MKQETLEILKKHPLFAWMTAPPMQWLAERGEEKKLSKGDRVYSSGSTSDAVFVVLEGTVSVKASGRDEILVGKGEALGHGSLIEIRERAGEARMSENGRILILNHSTLITFAREFPDPYSIMVTNLARMLAARIRELNEKKASRPYSPNREKKSS